MSRPKTYNLKNIEKKFRVNQEISCPEIFLIDENNIKIGILSTRDALDAAKEKGLDLIEVSPLSTPPVCKLLDFSHLKYQTSKHIAKAKAKTKKIDIKGVRLSLRISSHDLDLRILQTQKFLDSGDKVRVEIMLKGREKAKPQIAVQMLKSFISKLNSAKIEQAPLSQGNKISVIVAK